MSQNVFHRTRANAALFACLFALAFGPGCESNKGDGLRADYPPMKTAEMGTMRNVCVSGPIWFGGVPATADLDLAKRRGIESVIGLCSSDPDAEAELASHTSALGMNFLSVPIKPGLRTPAGTVDLVLGKLRESKNSPTLMYCESGGRAVMVFAVYRVVRGGIPLEEALDSARRAGMKPGESEAFVRAQVERLS